LRSIASFDKPMVGHFTDDERVLEFLSHSEHPRLAELGTELPRPLPANQGQAAGP
jgi:rhamnulose-1-phosphate aldolase